MRTPGVLWPRAWPWWVTATLLTHTAQQSSFLTEVSAWPAAHPSHNRNLLIRDDYPVKWRKIAENRSLHPVNLTSLKVIQELEADTFLVRVIVNKQTIQVYRDNNLVYEREGSLTHGFMSHSGVHVVVLHPARGNLMLGRQFLTHQPSEHRNLAACLDSLLPGRILVVAAVPDAVVFLAEDAVEKLEVMGASRIRNLAAFEAWVMVSHTPATTPSGDDHPKPKLPLLDQEVTRGRVWSEAVSIIRRPDGVQGSPLRVLAHVPKRPVLWCRWHEQRDMLEQRDFCDTYEGYKRLCSCSDPIRRSFRFSAPEIQMNEVIPVAMLTAIKPFNFYRQLLNLLETPGAAQTPILVFIDGPQTEIEQLAQLFGLNVLVHQPQGKPGSSTLLNMHFRFFQQTAWLLDADPTIFCVNAFSVNSYPEVASDPTVLRRLEMFPQFGWMVTRKWAREQYHYWIPEKEPGDWDWWLSSQNSLQGRHALVPEVARTFHAGAAGAHVTGWAQEHLFSHMFYNQDPNVKLSGLEDLILDKYEIKMQHEIQRAQDLEGTEDPCVYPFLPPNQPGPFRVFVASETKSDEYDSYFVMQLCLHGFNEDSREKFNGVVRFNLEGRILYIIGCPASPYCKLFPNGVRILKPSRELILAAENQALKWQTRKYPPCYQQRFTVHHPTQEFLMENIVYRYWNGTLIHN
ncbi:protein O-linked-mannose beta-1,2-N-acetylglucosaminyltransferase 1-like isoform X2 [Panulirus ornatus]|uniref:protein O-linked-mannose beta-1,2-N-acetylglucosaminyltransferase 1-like isoform X2 n=1 Tax=Panulirus ornatus TaxID=150431 RepID=UPI003A83F501